MEDLIVIPPLAISGADSTISGAVSAAEASDTLQSEE